MAMQRYVGPAASAVIYGTLGQREVAFDLLERAQLERDQLMTQAAHYAFFDPLRADPRFDTILAAIGRGR